MHEITLSQRALEIIEQQAQQAGARRVTGVWLKVGAFSCVEASALTFCFELVCRGTLAEGCELHITEQQAQQAGARRVTGVWLKVGAFSCVEASALTFCFELICRGTLAEGCELHIAEQQAECWCDRCQQYVHLVSQHVRRCPHCNNDQLQIVADDGLQIQRLELE